MTQRQNKLDTFFRFSEERCHERFFGFLHQLDDTFLNGILVLVQPAVDVILNLQIKNSVSYRRRLTLIIVIATPVGRPCDFLTISEMILLIYAQNIELDLT